MEQHSKPRLREYQRGRAIAPLALINARSEWAWATVGGITPAERLMSLVAEAGITEVVVVVSGDISGKQRQLLHYVKSRKLDLVPAVSLDHDDLPANADILWIDGAHIIDPRLIRALLKADMTTALCRSAADEKHSCGTAPAMLVRSEDVSLWRQRGIDGLSGYRRLFPDQIDPFHPYIRGTLYPYIAEVRDEKSAQDTTGLLIRAQQKKVMDLPAMYLDPFFENWLTRVFCNTSVTPNMVTGLGVAVAFTAALLFWHGFFVVGALAIFVIEILDGVDGKLARTKLLFSRIGEYEDVLDYFCENMLYVALGVGLSRAFPAAGYLPALLAGLLIVSDTVDNVLYTLSGRWLGKSIDLVHPFDSAFRLIAGRRNIYGFIFIIGFSLGYPLHTFAVAAIWASLTASVHGLRLFQLLVTKRGMSRGEATVHETATPEN